MTCKKWFTKEWCSGGKLKLGHNVKQYMFQEYDMARDPKAIGKMIITLVTLVFNTITYEATKPRARLKFYAFMWLEVSHIIFHIG
jgi:hypothetical protein